MDRALRYAAYVANILLVLTVLFLLSQAYRGSEFVGLLLMAVPPLLSLFGFGMGPDLEERRLVRKVNKARLHRTLVELGEAADSK